MVHAMFMHPDLGIGGAERLIVDAGLALQKKGHKVTYLTNHHNPDHSFLETKDGTLLIRVIGNWLPRTIFGYFHAFCAYLRMLYLTLYFIIAVVPVEHPDIVICDQIPIGIPLMKLFRIRTIFYCHFPDLLLSKPGGNLKKLYRRPIDWIEQETIQYADEILVNSKFTSKVFRSTFKKLSVKPMILYPSINTTMYNKLKKHDIRKIVPNAPEDGYIFLSINRYERKKNLSLALKALATLEITLPEEQYNKCHLIMAGGYDPDLLENVEHYKELMKLSEFHALQSKVTFMKSPSDQIKVSLLTHCLCVLYTPENEHFGIVPLEAMYAGKPVIAVNSGGPTETIEHGVTGYLTEPKEESMAFYMVKILECPELHNKLGKAGAKRFREKFSFEAFTRQLNSIVFNVTSKDE